MEHTGMLYLCATPIGNLEDITYRVLRTLSLIHISKGGKNGVLSGIEGKSPGKYKYRLNYYTDVLS